MKPPQDKATAHGLRVVAWELTRRCVLECRHCRGAARDTDYSGELSTDECRAVIDGLASFSAPLLILTGGEPMTRPDVYEIAAYAVGRGLRVVMAPCGYLVTPETAKKLKASGVSGVSISLDGAQAGTHDAFRGVQGAFDAACRAIRCTIAVGIGVQVNTTVTRHNAAELPAVLDLAVRLGARTLDLFFLVPTGRGALLKDLSLDAAEYEKVLAWVADTAPRAPVRLKTTCAPQSARR